MSIFQFNNRFFEELPKDKETKVIPRQVENACFSPVEPTSVSSPQLIHFNLSLAKQLGLSAADCNSDWFTQTFSGNQLLDGMQPFAMCYGGHQFGQWAGQLGDGRAINLAEVIDIDSNNQTLQLKGAGLTPYSRTADGLAVLRSSLREYLCSEAMHNLGIATTRALSLILTGEQVMRDMFYDGNAAMEQGAVVCRTAPSFVRFGSFQIFAFRQEKDILKQLMDFTIKYDFPMLLDDPNSEITTEVYEAWFDCVCEKTAHLMVDWMRVGFVHGVMNTDNMSILGLTIDYGPYGWLEGYDPNWTPNTTDAQGKRYAYGNQPQMAQWNLYQLANAIYPVVGRVENLESSLKQFADLYAELSQNMYAKKLGFETYNEKTDAKLIQQLFEVLSFTETDMTIFFRKLAKINQDANSSDGQLLAIIEEAYYQPKDLTGEVKDKIVAWLKSYVDRIKQQSWNDDERATQMNLTNPKYVLRNYLSQQAIEKAEQGDFSEIEKLMTIMKKPYDEQPEHEEYAGKRPEWARVKPGASMLSCSS